MKKRILGNKLIVLFIITLFTQSGCVVGTALSRGGPGSVVGGYPMRAAVIDGYLISRIGDPPTETSGIMVS